MSSKYKFNNTYSHKLQTCAKGGTALPLNNYRLKNGVFFQTGFGNGVSGHLDIMYRGNPANHFYDNKPTVFWH